MQLNSDDGGWLLIEPLMEEESAWKEVGLEERLQASTFSSPTRRREFLSWRALLHRKLGPMSISYAPCGAPELPLGMGYIGVSHSQQCVALRYSPQEICAVDIESSKRNFSRIKDRYLTPEEQHLTAHPAFGCIAWCAKECLYKLARRRELDLLRDLQLLEICFETAESGWLMGRLLNQTYRLAFRKFKEEWVVWY